MKVKVTKKSLLKNVLSHKIEVYVDSVARNAR